MILAFSLQSEINKIGAYAGFAAIIGLALLVLLYFAQARELRRLSDWVEQEGGRVRSVPAPSASPRPTVIPQAGVAAPPASAVTTAVPGVRRVAVGAAGAVPTASTAAAAASATAAAAPLAPASAAAPLTSATAVAPLAPATAAGADATRVAAPKSDLPPAPEQDAKVADGDAAPADGTAAPADGAEGVATPARAGAMPWGAAAVPLAAAPAATAEPSGSAQEAEAGAPGTDTPQDEYAAETAAAAALLPSDAAVVSVAPVVGAPADPPKAEPATAKVTPLRSAAAPAAATGIPAKPADAPARATPPTTDDPPPLAPSTPAGARPRFPPAPDVRAAPVGAAARVSGPSADAAKLDAGSTAPTRRRERERERPPADDDDRPPGLGAPTLRLIAAAVVIVAVLIFVASRVLGGGSSTPPGSQTTGSQSSGVSGPSPSTVRVAILNGTHTTGLATSVSATLVSKGFRKGAVADAPVQTHTSTIVGYTPGNRAAAVEVAADLSLSSSQVQPADSASTAVADTHHATSKVIVTLGSDFSQQ
jgi:hypothetical protein